jgi:hypothetical protein
MLLPLFCCNQVDVENWNIYEVRTWNWVGYRYKKCMFFQYGLGSYDFMEWSHRMTSNQIWTVDLQMNESDSVLHHPRLIVLTTVSNEQYQWAPCLKSGSLLYCSTRHKLLFSVSSLYGGLWLASLNKMIASENCPIAQEYSKSWSQ